MANGKWRMANRQRDRLRLTHYDLDAWKEAMRLASEVYILTADMPADERFGLVAHASCGCFRSV
jgi:hypothetical protein